MSSAFGWLAGFGFEWPPALLLLPVPALLLLVKTGARATADAPALPPRLAAALQRAAVSPHGARRSGPMASTLALIAWCALVAAFAQPTRLGEPVANPANARAMMLAVDLSSSMERRDFSFRGETLDRLEAVKRTGLDFLQRRRGDRVSLVLFGEEAFVAAPLTLDLDAVADSLREAAIGMAGRSTAIGDALGLSIARLRCDPAPEKVIVLLSDGTNNAGSVEPEDAAALARTLDIRIHAIGMASEGDGSATDPAADLDEKTLQAIAEASGGAFFRARTAAGLSEVYQAIDRLERAKAEAPPLLPKEDWRNPLILAATLLLLAFAVLRRTAAA